MERFKRFVIGLLISLFILPLQLVPAEFSYAKEAPPAKDTPASQIVLPPKSGKIELTDKRTANSNTYLKSDGNKEIVVYQSPINYQDSNKKWQTINTNLQNSKMQINPLAPKEYENTANNFRISLSQNLAQKAFSLQKNGAEVDLKLSDIKSADGTSLGFNKEQLSNIQPEQYQNRLTYKNVYKDTNITYYSMPTGIKEDIVINSYSGQNQFIFDLNISNASYEKQPDGSYIFYKPGTKEIQFRMPKFYMWDNKGGKDSESNQYSYNVGTEIVNNNGSLSVVLTADNTWLSSKDRVFPLTIDPSFDTADIEDTYIQTGYPDTQAWDQRALWTGQGSTKGIMRSLVLFNVPVSDLFGARIYSSRFEVLQYGNCTGVCNSAGVSAFTTTNFNPWDATWNNRPTELAKVGTMFNDSTWDWFKVDTTNAVNHWIYGNYDGSVPGGLEFIQDGEENWGYRTWAAQNNPDYTWGQPRLIIDMNDYNAEYYPTDTPNAIAGSEIEIPVGLKNIGRAPWIKSETKLSYHLINNLTGELVIWDGLRTELPRDVGKQDSVSVLAKLKTPPVVGSYTLQWDLVQEGTTWYSGQGVRSADRTITVSSPSFASMSHLGTESYYTKAGPVDLATGNLSYSNTDLSVNSPTGGLSVVRSYNSNSLDQTFSADSDGYIRSWLINGPYKENDTNIRLTRSYFTREDTVRPSEGSTSAGNLWFKNDSSSNITDLNFTFDKVGAIQNGFASNSAAYAHVYVNSPTTKSLQLKTGSDDGIKIWLNGIVKRSNDVYRGLSLDSDVDAVKLYSGWNDLLIKITQGTGAWNMSARFTNLDGTPINDLKYALNCPEVFKGSDIAAKGWTYSFDQKLFVNDLDNIYYRDGTGTINIFTKNVNGSYNTPAGTDIIFTANDDHSFTFTNKSGVKTNFDEMGRIANTIDLIGNKIEYQYDSSYPGKCIKIVDGTRFINIGYSGNLVSSIKDALNNTVNYVYVLPPSRTGSSMIPIAPGGTTTPTSSQTTGILIKVVDPNGQAFSYEYGSDGKMTKYLDKKSNSTIITYANNKVTQITDALGNATKFNYLKKATEITDALGNQSTANFNEANLLTAFTNAKKYTELYGYDSSYHTISITPSIPENEYYFYRYTYSYDTNGNLISEKDPAEAVTSYAYTGNDLIKMTDPNGNISTYTYSTDGKRLLLSSKDAKGNVSSYTYDTKGRVISTTDPKGAITKYTYNSTGDIATMVTPKNEVIRYGYDVLGRKTVEISPMGFATQNYYDKLSRLIQVVDSAGLKILYSYDLNGNILSETNPNSTKTTHSYDKLNRPITVTDEVGAAISYSYDAVGNKIAIKDANGKTTKYIYDELNQLTKQIDPTGKEVAIDYDRNGNIANATDQNGNATTNTYDKSGTLTSTKSGGITSNIFLDAIKNITKVSATNLQTTEVAYDKNNNPIQIKSSVLGTETAAYDKTSNTIATAVATAAMDYVRDLNGFVTSIASKLLKTGTSLGTASFSNDPDGKLRVVTKPNADTSTFSYDSSGRVSTVSNLNKLGTIQKNYSYTYDLASNQTSITDNTGKKFSYAYDARNELIAEGTKKYTYDPMGNRKTVTDGTAITNYVYDTAGDANRLLKTTYADGKTISYDYDDSGNIVKTTDSKNGVTTYEYNSDGYFTKATLPDKSTVQYVYDSITKLRAQRVQTTASGAATTTKFVYSGDRLVSETDSTGNVLKNYTWDEQENLISFTLPVAGVMTTYYYVKDAKGDVIGLSDKDGKMVVAYEYDAWGNLTLAKNLVTTGIPTNLYMQNPRLYGSYWYDSALGLYFMKTRLYNAQLGRFMSKDQVSGGGGSALDFNPYIYCNNNPITNIDPSGKSFWNKVAEFGSKVVKAVVKAYVAVNNAIKSGITYAYNVYKKVNNYISNKIFGTLAKNETIGRFADWATANPYRLAGVSIAIGVACVGGYLGVQAAITYAAGLGAYGATGATAEAGGAGGAGYKTYEEFKSVVGSPGVGNQWHHVVEQCQIEKSGFSPTMIQNTNNIVSISTKAHIQISGYYSSSPDFANGMRVRDWLAGQSFQQQYDFGIQVMKSVGIIK